MSNLLEQLKKKKTKKNQKNKTEQNKTKGKHWHSFQRSPHIYTTKIMESGCVCVCVCVCMYVCMSGYAFRHALRYRAETLHGGRGRAPEVCGHIFKATLPWGQRSSRGQSALEMSYSYQIWREEPIIIIINAQNVVHCWGRRSCRGQLGVNMGQFA